MRTTTILRSWWGWGLGLAALAAVSSWGGSGQREPLVDSVLLVSPSQVAQLSPTGALLATWPVEEKPLAAALDRREGTVWLLSARSLVATGIDGRERFRMPIGPPELRERPEPAALALRPWDGSVWAALGNRVVNISASGERLGSFEVEAPVVGLALDAARDILWTATAARVDARDAVSGEDLHRLAIETAEPVLGISLGVQGRVWVRFPSEVQRFSAAGSAPETFPLQGLHALAADGTGGAWATDGGHLLRFGLGWLNVWPLGDLESAIQLTPDWARGGVWVSDGKRALWLDREGQRGEVLGLPGGKHSSLLVVPGEYHLEAHGRAASTAVPSAASTVAGSLHVDPPEIAVAEPGRYVLVNQPSPEIRISFSATDRPLDPGTFAVELDGADLSTSCTLDSSLGEAVCLPPGPLPGGPHVITASVADDEGRTATAQKGFHLLLGQGRHEVALPASADTFLRALLPNQTSGSQDYLQVRWVGLNRALARFDLDEAAPWIETLVSARLELTVTANADNWGPSGRAVSVHAVDEPWTEEGATWHCAVDENPLNFRADCPKRWNGGAYQATPTDSVVHEDGLEGPVSWDVTADLEAYLAGAATNHGWLFRREQELWPGWVRYGSREGPLAAAPRLVLVFDGGESLDTTPPALAIVAPAEGTVVTTGSPELLFTYSDDLSGVDPGTLAATLGGEELGLACSHDSTGATCSLSSALADGPVTITATVADREGNVSAAAEVSFVVNTSPLPPDPATVAPPLDRTVATDVFTSTEFLYTGANPIQAGVAPGTIEGRRVAVLRGRVLERSGAPLAGVTVTVLDHPEFGSTLSRADGVFDLAVNGGGLVTLNYEREGYLPSQRQQRTPWRDYRWFEDVVLVPVDEAATTIIAGSAETQIARGTPQTDADGTRQATLLFAAGTTAEMELADGTTQPLTTLTIRATEYTVGENGPQAMPGPLPPTVAYTYAVELAADEAEAAGAVEVRFNQPAYLYVENFIGFPVGEPVPLGAWDRRQAAWIGSPNGRVIEILGADATGLAEVDVDGSGLPADAATLEELGFTLGERQRLTELYTPGTELWRSPIPHLTPWDCNWPFAPPNDAELPPDDDPFLPDERQDPGDPNDPDAPDNPNNPDDAPDPDDPDAMSDPEDPEGDEPPEEDDCEQSGSVMECLSQVLGESVGLTGAPYRLHYRSDRQLGFDAAYSLRIAVSGEAVPASLKEIRLRVEVAGVVVSDQRYPPQPNQRISLTWDGRDTYERTVQGQVPVSVTKSYVYDLRYTLASRDFEVSWGRFPESSVSAAQSRQTGGTTRLSRTYRGSLEGNGITRLGTWDARGQGLGGWSLDVHHAYDPTAQVLHPGNGARRAAQEIGPVVTRYAGTGTAGNGGDGGPALDAEMSSPTGIALAADGSLYVADTNNHRVRKVSPEGVITTVAGTGEACIVDTCTEPDGDCGDDDGLTTAVGGMLPGIPGGPGGPGGGGEPVCGNGGPATSALLNAPEDVAIGPDGSLYIADTGIGCVRRVDLSGVIEPVAGSCSPPADSGGGGPQGLRAEPGLQAGDGLPATSIALDQPFDIEVTPEGSLFVAARGEGLVVFVATDGSYGVAAGGGAAAAEDGLRARDARLNGLAGLARGEDGTLYLSQATLGAHRIWSVSIDGRLSLVAGGAAPGFDGDGGLAADALLDSPGRLVAVADGSLYLSDRGNQRIRTIDSAGVIFTVVGNGEDDDSSLMAPATGSPLRRIDGLLVAPDAELYLADSRQNIILRAGLAFDGYSEGEILIAAESGGEVYVFDPRGRHQRTVHALTGADLYTFDYDANGLLSAVTDRSDRRTEIERDGAGNPTKIIGPYGQATALVTDAEGYLERVVDPAGGTTSFLTLNQGLLVRKVDPRNFATEWDYATLGRLARERAPDGGVQEFLRYGQPDNPEYSVVRRDGVGIPTLYRTKKHRGGLKERIVSDGEQRAERLYVRKGGLRTIRRADGTLSQTQMRPDPRFGMQAPRSETAITRLPNGLAMTTRTEAETVLSNPNDPMSLEILTETYSINGLSYTSVFDASQRTSTLTSPEGRISMARLDPQGRLVEYSDPGVAPFRYEYRPDGLLSRVAQGSGTNERTTIFSYDAFGRLESLTDPLGQQVQMEYDASNRLVRQVYQEEEIRFGYDAVGNLSSLTPPGRSAHSLSYSPVNLFTGHQAPGGSTTTFSYSSNHRLLRRERSGGEVVTFDYDALGRRTVSSQPTGDTTVTYHPEANQVATIRSPGEGGTVSVDWLGVLPQRLVWSGGAVTGSFEMTFNGKLQVSSYTINGGVSTPLSYDQDGLITEVGDLQILRSPTSGRIAGTSLGGFVTSTSHDEFGEVDLIFAHHDSEELLSQSVVRGTDGRVFQLQEIVQGEQYLYEYAYDSRGRIEEVRRGGVRMESYEYDSNGNRTVSVDLSATRTSTFDGQDRLLTDGDISFEYTPSGDLWKRIQGEAELTYTFDPFGNLRTATLTDGTEISYVIDG